MNENWTEKELAQMQRIMAAKLVSYNIPDYMHEGVLAYIMDGRHTGSFLQAVLTNNLNEAVKKADDFNQAALVDYVKFLHNYAPWNSFGSEEAVTAWKKDGGLRGRMTVRS